MRNRWLIALLLVPVLAGCVTSQTYEAKEAELAVARDKLQACQTQAKTDLDAAATARAKLEGEIGDARRELDQCSKATEAARQYTEKLKAREVNLREKLKSELVAKDVEISRLRDQLSVRVLDRILFRSGSADILPEGKKVLDKLAAVLASTDDMIRVEGHTDIVPIGQQLKVKYFSNWELSAARASSVVRFFEHGHNIESTRMEAVGFSKFRPVALGNTPEDLQRNRRVEIVLTAPRTLESGMETALPPGDSGRPR